ncbi:MAG: hypothetical protein HY898_13725 [Deltaproteobacteria bacterium]|nr:hypothetical protein [Deltaproteobacteria bacterium]
MSDDFCDKEEDCCNGLHCWVSEHRCYGAFLQVTDSGTKSTPFNEDLLIRHDYAWGKGDAEMAPFPAATLTDLTVRVHSPTPSTEVLSFIRDPEELRNYVRDVSMYRPDWERQLYVKDYYENELWRVFRSWRLPRAFSTSPDQGGFNDVPLELVDFVPPDPYACGLLYQFGPWAEGPQYDRPITPRLHALRVVDHGACRREVPLQPILDEITANISAQNELSCPGLIIPVSCYATGLHSMVVLTHDPSQAIDQGGGGFYLDMSLRVDNAADPLFANLLAIEKYEYALGLIDGFLSITGIPFNYHDVTGFKAQEVSDGLTQALMHTLVDTFNEQAKAAQFAPIFGEGATATPLASCVPTNPDPCTAAINALIAGVGVGATVMGGFSDIEKNAMKAAVSKADNWICAASNGNPPVCRFAVRAKRLTMMPDAADLVFFDDKEVSNPVYGLWVATHAVELPAGTPALCQSLPPPIATRTYAIVAPYDVFVCLQY